MSYDKGWNAFFFILNFYEMLENLTLFQVVFTSLFSTGTMKRIYQQYASFQISKQSILSKLYCYMSFSSKDQLEELQYNVDNAIPDIDGWKAHILRAAHQDTAKSAVIENPANYQVLIIMDWAMK